MASLLSPESTYSLLARRMIDALMTISMSILEFLEAHVSQIVKLRLYVLHHLSLHSGLPRGTILFTVALFSGLPLGVLFRMIQGGDRGGSWFQRKALLSLLSGTMISLITFGKTTVHAFTFHCRVYVYLNSGAARKRIRVRRARKGEEKASGL